MDLLFSNKIIMLNFFKKLSIKNLEKNLKESFERFPLSFVSSILVFSILEFLILQENFILNTTEELLIKGIFALSVVYFLSIWVYLLSEKFELNKLKTCLLQWVVVLFWLAFFYSFPENLFNNFVNEEITYIFITFIWVISFIFIAPFVKKLYKKDCNNDEYYTYFNEIFSKIAMAIIAWLFLMLLWMLAIMAVFALFELNFLDEGKTYWTWAAFSLSIFAPLYFLAIAPEKETNLVLFDSIKSNKFYNFLVNFIALPAIIVYFLILYSYTWKVLLNFQNWPEWIISWMVIGFSLFWYLVYIFSFAFEENLSLVRVFRKILPFAVLFQTPMLFYAIYLRIDQYDFTINRYLVVVFWIFLVVISLYFIISKKKNLITTPAILTLFIIIISIWPWGVYQFPENRQINLLEKDLINAEILQEWEIKLPKAYGDVEAELSWKIYEKLDYLCDFHWCDSMSDLLWWVIEEIKDEDKIEWTKNHLEQIEKYKKAIEEYEGKDEARMKINIDNLERLEKEVYTWISSWEFKSKLTEKLKVERYSSYIDKNKKYINFRVEYNLISSFIDVRWYDYIFDLVSNSRLDIVKNSDIYTAKMDIDTEKFVVYKWWIEYEEFDLDWDFDLVYEENKDNINNFSQVILKENFILEKKWEKIDIKLVLSEFWVLNPNYDLKDDDFYSYVNWKVLVREK